MANQDADMELLEKHVALIGEHFENVQIFASRYVGDDSDPEAGTVSANSGAGNWHARRDQVREWLLKGDERTKVYVRKEEEEDE